MEPGILQRPALAQNGNWMWREQKVSEQFWFLEDTEETTSLPSASPAPSFPLRTHNDRAVLCVYGHMGTCGMCACTSVLHVQRGCVTEERHGSWTAAGHSPPGMGDGGDAGTPQHHV